MAPPAEYSEDALVEQPAIERFRSLGWETANLLHEFGSDGSSQGRSGMREVFIRPRLESALRKLNPSLDQTGIDLAVEQLTRDRSRMIPVNANQEVHALLRDGVKVTITDMNGDPATETIRVIDWREWQNNDFFLTSQFWVSGDCHERRCDLVGFVNGIPLLFMELKGVQHNVKKAFDRNLQDYLNTIPHLFIPNGFVVLSNGADAVMGSAFASWEHLKPWKQIDAEGRTGAVDLETLIRGACTPERLLDIVENFTVFEQSRGGLVKKVGRYHQFFGVNKAIEAVRNIRENKGRLGVFWHTQGSGKSLSMAFFTQKIFRKLLGNWTFVVVTDRDDLDRQIYKNFANIGAVTEDEAHAGSGAELKKLLTEDHRYVFTLIQKFHTRNGERYPTLSERDDIIVITDEAHRSQYDLFALNMRNALPNAAFIGFTGTPLIDGESERTREVFGDYVSIYDFKQSVEDGATVRLYYENRIPEVQLTNDQLNEDLERLLDSADLDEEQEAKLQREFAREYHIITREERLETIAEDLVQHFVSRGHRGKAMMISIDKATALRMHDKVRAHWAAHIEKLRKELSTADDERRETIEAIIKEMKETDMAVVVSPSQNEVETLRAKGLDILPHRERMRSEKLDEKFKDPNDPLGLVFVCAMWITGFDAPSCSTIYLDKPMRNHTLMQTIARANRVYEGKQSGLIVDYVGILRHLKKALTVYALPKPSQGGKDDEDTPVLDKAKLVEFLQAALAEARDFCSKRGVDLTVIKEASGFGKVGAVRKAAVDLVQAKRATSEAVEFIIGDEDSKKEFLFMISRMARVFRALKPDPICNEVAPDVILMSVLADAIRDLTPAPDINEIMKDVERLLDDSIAAEGFVIYRRIKPDLEPLLDLSRLDFDKLQEQYKQGRKRTEMEKLRNLINRKLTDMVRQNRTRMDFMERFLALIAEYNSGSRNVDELFSELITLAGEIKQEQQRGESLGLTEEELALYDILTRPEPKLTLAEEKQIRKAVHEMLDVLKREKLVLDWRKGQRTKAAVEFFIQTYLDEHLPDAYDKKLYETKCHQTYNHIFDSYAGAGMSIYSNLSTHTFN